MKGTEDLGNGLTVGFVLENGFTADDGVDGGSAMFDRESMLFLEGNFGKLAFGRIGSFNQGSGLLLEDWHADPVRHELR